MKENGEEERNITYIWSLSCAEFHPKLIKVASPLLGSNECIQARTVTLMDILPHARQYQE